MEMSTNIRSGDAWRRGCVHATLELITDEFDVSTSCILAAGRSRSHISLARHTAMYLCHVICSIPIIQVGKIFNRDRTTVAYACQKIEDMRDNVDFERFITRLETRVKRRMDALEFQQLIETRSTYVAGENKMIGEARYVQSIDNVMYVRFGQ